MSNFIKTRKSGNFNALWFYAIYEKLAWGYRIIFPDGSEKPGDVKMCSLRKTVTKNYRKWKHRKKMLNAALKEGKKQKIGLWADFWWAKFWRKGKTLRRLALELTDTEDLPTYEISNIERSRQVIDALNQFEKYYQQFDWLFTKVDPMLGWQIEHFKDCLLSQKEKEIKRDVPRRFIQYFQ